jgi:actin-related protein
MSTLVVDNGAGVLKAGLTRDGVDYNAPSLAIKPVLLHNCTAKSRAEKKFFVADGLDTAVDLAALYIRRAHDRGYIVNWDIEQDVWERMCHKDVLGVKPSETSVLVTEPMFSPNELKDSLDEFIFEEMGFQRYCVATPPLLSFADHRQERKLCRHTTRFTPTIGLVLISNVRQSLRPRQRFFQNWVRNRRGFSKNPASLC